MQRVKRILVGIGILIVLLNLAAIDVTRVYDYSSFTQLSQETDFDYGDMYPLKPVIDRAEKENTFNSSGLDTLVFVHIQKTGGSTLERRFVENIDHHTCDKVRKHKKRNCPRPLVHSNVNREAIQPVHPGTWIFSRFSTGWECGLHADWVELRDCVAPRMNELYGEKRRKLIYITNLRSPVQRFLSEWKHVQRGATWKTSTLRCANHEHTELTTHCFAGRDNWANVSLSAFLACDHNLAFNRQTRMLADLTQIGCYANIFNLTDTHLDRVMLDSAKGNLSRMRWFGLVEFQQASQYLFEGAFEPLHFIAPFSRWNSTNGENELRQLKPEILALIKRRNHLDIELYKYARDLFFQRLAATYKQLPS